MQESDETVQLKKPARNEAGPEKICFFLLKSSLKAALLVQSALILTTGIVWWKPVVLMEKIPPAVGGTLQPGRAAMTSVSRASEPWAPVPGEHGRGPWAAFKRGQDRRGAALQAAAPSSHLLQPAAGRVWPSPSSPVDAIGLPGLVYLQSSF